MIRFLAASAIVASLLVPASALSGQDPAAEHPHHHQ